MHQADTGWGSGNSLSDASRRQGSGTGTYAERTLRETPRMSGRQASCGRGRDNRVAAMNSLPAMAEFDLRVIRHRNWTSGVPATSAKATPEERLRCMGEIDGPGRREFLTRAGALVSAGALGTFDCGRAIAEIPAPRPADGYLQDWKAVRASSGYRRIAFT